jgi:hypothetical protein
VALADLVSFFDRYLRKPAGVLDGS